MNHSALQRVILLLLLSVTGLLGERWQYGTVIEEIEDTLYNISETNPSSRCITKLDDSRFTLYCVNQQRTFLGLQPWPRPLIANVLLARKNGMRPYEWDRFNGRGGYRRLSLRGAPPQSNQQISARSDEEVLLSTTPPSTSKTYRTTRRHRRRKPIWRKHFDELVPESCIAYKAIIQCFNEYVCQICNYTEAQLFPKQLDTWMALVDRDCHSVKYPANLTSYSLCQKKMSKTTTRAPTWPPTETPVPPGHTPVYTLIGLLLLASALFLIMCFCFRQKSAGQGAFEPSTFVGAEANSIGGMVSKERNTRATVQTVASKLKGTSKIEKAGKSSSLDAFSVTPKKTISFRMNTASSMFEKKEMGSKSKVGVKNESKSELASLPKKEAKSALKVLSKKEAPSKLKVASKKPLKETSSEPKSKIVADKK